MRILVPIKQVPETNAVRMDETTGTMVREGVEAIVNPLDLYAVETALRLKEAHGGEVIVLTMGPAGASKALREALSMGCDGAVLISHKAFAGSDTWATARVLTEAVRKIGAFDLILCGERATDGDTGQVGPELAAFLDLPIVSYVGAIDNVSVGGARCPQRAESVGTIRVRRLVEEGHELLECDLPALLTVVKEIADPRLPTLQGKRRARLASIPAWGPEELGVAAEDVGLKGSPTRVVKVFRPKVARQCEKLVAADEAGIEAAADRMVTLLKEKVLL